MAGNRTHATLVIDARPRGPRGALAGERVRGRTVLEHLLEAAGPGVASVHVDPDDQVAIAALTSDRGPAISTDPTPDGAAVLRTDRLYDRSRLRRALKRGTDVESAAIWRLDTPNGLRGAEDEWTRRGTYQPLGRYWALTPARAIARSLAPTFVRPNAVTIAALALMLGASALVAVATPGWGVNIAVASALALALVLDTADGHLARLQGTATPFGKWLDAWLDELCDMTLHAAIAWSCFVTTHHAGWLLVGMTYGMGKYVFSVGATHVGDVERTENPGDPGPERPSPFRAVVRLAGHADLRWHLWIVLAACGRLDVALGSYTVYYPARAVLAVASKAREARHG